MRARTSCQNTTAPKTQTTSPTTPHFQRFSPKWSAIWVPHRLKSRPRRHQLGELHYTSLRHAARRLRVVQTPATAGVEGTGGAGGHGRLRDAGQAAAPVGGSGAWPDNEPTRRAKLAARTTRGRAAVHGRTKQPGPEQQREGRCTRYGPLHPLRGAAPDQKGCTAYGSGVSHPITRTNAESARRPPTISQASSMIGPKATTATRLTTSGRVRIRRSPGSMHQAEATPGHPLTMVG